VQERKSGRNKILRFLSIPNRGFFAPMITNGMTIKPAELARILLESVTDGTAKVLSENGIQHERISKAEAYRLYGRAQVDRWIAEGLLKPSTGQIFISPSGIDRKKLEAVSAASNRGTYLPVAER
jgi:hypothetical protein